MAVSGVHERVSEAIPVKRIAFALVTNRVEVCALRFVNRCVAAHFSLGRIGTLATAIPARFNTLQIPLFAERRKLLKDVSQEETQAERRLKRSFKLSKLLKEESGRQRDRVISSTRFNMHQRKKEISRLGGFLAPGEWVVFERFQWPEKSCFVRGYIHYKEMDRLELGKKIGKYAWLTECEVDEDRWMKKGYQKVSLDVLNAREEEIESGRKELTEREVLMLGEYLSPGELFTFKRLEHKDDTANGYLCYKKTHQQEGARKFPAAWIIKENTVKRWKERGYNEITTEELRERVDCAYRVIEFEIELLRERLTEREIQQLGAFLEPGELLTFKKFQREGHSSFVRGYLQHTREDEDESGYRCRWIGNESSVQLRLNQGYSQVTAMVLRKREWVASQLKPKEKEVKSLETFFQPGEYVIIKAPGDERESSFAEAYLCYRDQGELAYHWIVTQASLKKWKKGGCKRVTLPMLRERQARS